MTWSPSQYEAGLLTSLDFKFSSNHNPLAHFIIALVPTSLIFPTAVTYISIRKKPSHRYKQFFAKEWTGIFHTYDVFFFFQTLLPYMVCSDHVLLKNTTVVTHCNPQRFTPATPLDDNMTAAGMITPWCYCLGAGLITIYTIVSDFRILVYRWFGHLVPVVEY